MQNMHFARLELVESHYKHKKTYDELLNGRRFSSCDSYV